MNEKIEFILYENAKLMGEILRELKIISDELKASRIATYPKSTEWHPPMKETCESSEVDRV